jgi:hypothetical protein
MMCSSIQSRTRQGLNLQASVPKRDGLSLELRALNYRDVLSSWRFMRRALSWSLGIDPWQAAIPFLLVFAIWAVGFVGSLRVDRFEPVRAGIRLAR